MLKCHVMWKQLYRRFHSFLILITQNLLNDHMGIQKIIELLSLIIIIIGIEDGGGRARLLASCSRRIFVAITVASKGTKKNKSSIF